MNQQINSNETMRPRNYYLYYGAYICRIFNV